jgi:hypothetical protein
MTLVDVDPALLRVPGLQPRSSAAQRQTVRVCPRERVRAVPVRVRAGFQTERIRREVCRDLRVVVTVQVLVQAGLGVGVLAGETQVAIHGFGVVRWCRIGGTPQSGASLPVDVALGSDEFGRGTDHVGDDGVEASSAVGRCLLSEPGEEGRPCSTGYRPADRLGARAMGLRSVVPGGDPAVREDLLSEECLLPCEVRSAGLRTVRQIVVDDRRRAAVDRGADVVHRSGERAPGLRGVPQLARVGLGPPHAQLEKDVAGLVLNAHRHRRSARRSSPP